MGRPMCRRALGARPNARRATTPWGCPTCVARTLASAVLTVVPTPLGNLRDITLRALDALGAASVIACEDTRRTRALLSAHAIPAPELVACDERREPQVAERLVARALAGEPVALVSDSGMPLIADPGPPARGARARRRLRGRRCCPGPSAVETALVASGLAAEGYAFARLGAARGGRAGALPRRGARRAAAERHVRVAAAPRAPRSPTSRASRRSTRSRSRAS